MSDLTKFILAMTGLVGLLALVGLAAYLPARGRTPPGGWRGLVVIDNDTMARSPKLSQHALREGTVRLRYGEPKGPIQDGGAIVGWLAVGDSVRFRPSRMSRGHGARPFFILGSELEELRLEMGQPGSDDSRLSWRLCGEVDRVEMMVNKPGGLEEVVERFLRTA